MSWLFVSVLLLFQVLFVYAPVMNTLFGSAPLPLRDWLIPIAVGSGVFLIVEGEKAITRRASRARRGGVPR